MKFSSPKLFSVLRFLYLKRKYFIQSCDTLSVCLFIIAQEKKKNENESTIFFCEDNFRNCRWQ